MFSCLFFLVNFLTQEALTQSLGDRLRDTAEPHQVCVHFAAVVYSSLDLNTERFMGAQPDQAIKILSCCSFAVPPLPRPPRRLFMVLTRSRLPRKCSPSVGALGSFMCPQRVPLQTRVGGAPRCAPTPCRRRGAVLGSGIHAAENMRAHVSVKILFLLGRQGYKAGRCI